MFKPVPMKKVRMIGLQSDLQAALSLWRRLGVLQLEITPYKKLGLAEGRPLEIYDEISEQLVKIRAILGVLKPVPLNPAPLDASPLEMAKTITIKNELLQISQEKKTLAKKITPLLELKKSIKRIESINLDFSALPPGLDYILFSTNSKSVAELKAQWPKHSVHSHWLSVQDPLIQNNTLCLVAVPSGLDCSKALAGVQVLSVPKTDGTPKQALLKIESELADISEQTRKLDSRLKALSEQFYPICMRIEEALSLDADMAREASKFANSQECFYAQGWIKAHDFERLKGTTKKFLEGRISIAQVPVSEHHFKGCPTVLENPSAWGPFQFLLQFLSIPKATELDPTFFMMFTIPIAYGMIVGDAGYALISILLALLIGRAVQKGGLVWNLSRIWLIGAIPSFIFGVIYDEYFAFSHKAFLGGTYYTPLVHRVGDIQTLLLLSIGVGWLTIALGYLLGAINVWSHSKKHAAAKLSWILVQIGGTLAVATFLLNAMPLDIGLLGVGILAFGVIVLLMTEGVLSLVEIPGLASNIMSYARIAAVGVGGVILAEAINTLIMPNPAAMVSFEGMVIFLLTAAVYSLAHAANAFIAMFEGFIHGARLSVIEFFSKFFSGGGVLFNPFMLKRKYTMDAELNAHANNEFADINKEV
ncbi:MAG: V-type ATPase 116kDa subunit family protein [Candidatus Micrarchaeia archaeon]